MIKEKLTDNEYYNVYRCNNSGAMFVGIDFFTVGQEDYPTEFNLSIREDKALELCKELNEEYQERHKCAHCHKNWSEYDFYIEADEIICFLCGGVSKLKHTSP